MLPNVKKELKKRAKGLKKAARIVATEALGVGTNPKPPKKKKLEPFVDDVQFFSKEHLEARKAWRRTLRDTGELGRLKNLANIHSGKRAFLIGNGPSIKSQDLTRLAGEITFVTNWFANHEDFDLIKPSYYCISSHEVFGGWSAPEPLLDRTMHKTLTSTKHRAHHFFPLWARDTILADPEFPRDKTNFLVFERPKATILSRGRMNWDLAGNLDDGLTGIITFCLPLALHMGIEEVYLLGCDCDYGIKAPEDPKNYFYDFKKHTTTTSKFETLDRVWGPGGEIFQVYEIVRRQAEARGLVIKNATRGGLLEVFPRVELEELLG